MTNNGQTPGGNTTTAGAVEQLAMARKVAEQRIHPNQLSFDEHVATALAAIIETQRLDAELAEQAHHASGMDWTPRSIAAAIRTGHHYGKEKP